MGNALRLSYSLPLDTAVTIVHLGCQSRPELELSIACAHGRPVSPPGLWMLPFLFLRILLPGTSPSSCQFPSLTLDNVNTL